jgi:hypothetical protein
VSDRRFKPRDWPLTPEQEPPPNARAIRLTLRTVAWVDEEDYPPLADRYWHALRAATCEALYAVRTNQLSDGRRVREYMHRVVMGAPDQSLDVDHREHHVTIGVVDNRKQNLRVCTRQGNAQAQRKGGRKAFTSQYKGVSLKRSSGSWVVHLRIAGESTQLGSFAREHYAAMAYDYFARRHFREFARTNFPAVEGPVHVLST